MSELPPIQQDGNEQETKQLDMGGHRLLDESAPSAFKIRKQHLNSLIVTLLKETVPDYCWLVGLREKGWNNPAGDKYFEEQRRNTDKPSKNMAKMFYKMMQKIGAQLQAATDAFSAPTSSSAFPGIDILDLCMAPGRFIFAALQHSPGSSAVGFSLPNSLGGHHLFLPKSFNVTCKFLDITMLAGEMGVTQLPPGQADHPDAEHLIFKPVLSPDHLFDLAICDGQVLRLHPRATYREKREAQRLLVTQLAIGLQHLRPGGTMIILLHKVEAWDNFSLIHTCGKFSSLRLFKPSPYHATRSSFYLLATNVQSLDVEAVAAIQAWKDLWRLTTFGTDEELDAALLDGTREAESVLRDFGPRFVELAGEVWKVQARALAKAPYTQG